MDEYYKAILSSLDFQLFDLERAEVLRGPQGTLFGRNATGGLVQYLTVKPSQETEGYVDVTAAEYGEIITEGAVGGGLTDTVAGRVSAIYSKHDGYSDQKLPWQLKMAMPWICGALAASWPSILAKICSYSRWYPVVITKTMAATRTNTRHPHWIPTPGLPLKQPNPAFCSQ